MLDFDFNLKEQKEVEVNTKNYKKQFKRLLENKVIKNFPGAIKFDHPRLGVYDFRPKDNMILIHQFNKYWRTLDYFLKYNC